MSNHDRSITYFTTVILPQSAAKKERAETGYQQLRVGYKAEVSFVREQRSIMSDTTERVARRRTGRVLGSKVRDAG